MDGSQISSEETSIILDDPVCGMQVLPEKDEWITNYKGLTYYFCAESCRDAFQKTPEKFIRRPPKKRKGIWARYLERLNRTTGGKSQKCCP